MWFAPVLAIGMRGEGQPCGQPRSNRSPIHVSSIAHVQQCVLMKPAPFDYLRPEFTGEILELLRQYREEAKILAGGQSLVPILNFRLNRVKYLIDINRVAEL